MLRPIRWRRRVSVCFAFLATWTFSCVSHSSQARAQDVYVEDVYNQLAAAAFAVLGSANIVDARIDKLSERYYHEHRFNGLQPGETYAFIGVCDRDCSDIDLQLYDGRKRLIDEDRGYEDIALVLVRPAYRDTFTVRVTIPNCSASYCTYGVGLFQTR